MREQYPSETQDRVMVRLPDGMRDKLKAGAKAGHRTMNAEIVARLEFTFANRVTVQGTGFDVEGPEYIDDPKPAGRRSLEQRIADLEARLAVVEAALETKG